MAKTKKKKDLRVLLPVCIIVPLLAVLIVAMVVTLAAGSADATLKRYIDLTLQADAEGMLELYHSGTLRYVSSAGELSPQDMQNNLQRKLTARLEGDFLTVCGTVEDYSYDVESKTDADDATVAEMEANYGVQVSDTVVYQVAITATGEKGEATREFTVGLAKIDGDWYLYDLLLLI